MSQAKILKFIPSIETGAEYQSNKLLNTRPLMSKTCKALKKEVLINVADAPVYSAVNMPV